MTALSDAIVSRVRALLAKTVENGATEAEAIAAASKARELMDRYNCTLTDLEIAEEPVVKTEIDRPNARRMAAVDYCLSAIAKFCDCKTWYSIGETRRVVFFGHRNDTDMAGYLYQMIATAIKSELDLFQRRQGYRDRKETSSFQVGMAVRIADRLRAMSGERQPAVKTASGTALVLVKTAAVDQAFAKLGLRFGAARSMGMSTGSSGAYNAGKAAGDRVNLSRPVSHTDRRRIA